MFGGLFGGKSGSGARKPQKLSSAVSSSITNVVGAKAIPTMPGAAQKAFQLATDPSAEARDFIEVIESDEALSARVIKIANSVFFERGKQSKTIEESVLVIGINELRCLLNATSLGEIFPSNNPMRVQLWINDIATAIISRTLAQRFVPAKAEVAFLGGLMHDIGKLLLLQRTADDYVKVGRLVEREGMDFLSAEQQLFAFDHTEVGQLIAEKWNFTPELIDIIRSHHRPWEGGGQPSLVEIVKAADVFAHSMGLGHPKTYNKFRSALEGQAVEAWDALKIPESERKQQLANFKKSFEMEYDLYSGKGLK